jgi:purine nucleoside phosphorylase
MFVSSIWTVFSRFLCPAYRLFPVGSSMICVNSLGQILCCNTAGSLREDLYDICIVVFDRLFC